MKKHTLNRIIMSCVVLAMLVYDIYLAVVGNSTLSNSILYVGQRHEFLPYFLGVLCTHFFVSWQYPKRWLQYPLIAVSLLLLIIDLLEVTNISPTVMLLVGGCCGLMWQQKSNQ